MPPAFVLSQNQTLRTKMLNNRSCYFTFAHRKLTVAFNVWFISVFLRSHCLPTTISILLSQSDWAHRTIQFFKEHPVHTAQNSPPESFLHFHEKWTSLGFSYQCTGLILSFISVSQFSLRSDRKFFSESASQTLSIRFHQRFGWRVLNLHLIFVLSSAIRKKILIFFHIALFRISSGATPHQRRQNFNIASFSGLSNALFKIFRLFFAGPLWEEHPRSPRTRLWKASRKF